jgi:hypothetical protein
VGSHLLVSWMCKGSFEKGSPPCKVPSVWDPTLVLDNFMHWHIPLSYAQLVRKCAFILAIFSGRCFSELFNLKCDVSHLQISNNLMQLVPASLSKTDKAGCIGPPICLKFWREDTSLCPVAVIRALLEARDALDIQHDQLFFNPRRPDFVMTLKLSEDSSREASETPASTPHRASHTLPQLHPP